MDKIKVEMIEGVCNSCGCDKQLHGVGTLARIKGVRINCEGDIQLHEADTYEPVEVPPQDSVFGLDGIIPEISVLVGMAIKVYRVRPDPEWKDNDAIGVHVNQPTTWLFRIVNPNEKAFGWVPVAWLGTVIVFRADQQDLTPQQMEALSHFSRYNVRVALQHAAGAGWSLWDRVKVYEMMTPEKFRSFFAEFKEEKKGNPTWEAATPPL